MVFFHTKWHMLPLCDMISITFSPYLHLFPSQHPLCKLPQRFRPFHQFGCLSFCNEWRWGVMLWVRLRYVVLVVDIIVEISAFCVNIHIQWILFAFRWNIHVPWILSKFCGYIQTPWILSTFFENIDILWILYEFCGYIHILWMLSELFG